jgi:peptidoglycan/LPS O-acetylase OafA/YrhL
VLSYTVYATHLPMRVLLRSWLTFERGRPRDVAHWAGVVMGCLITAACAFALSRATETRTAAARHFW